MVFTIDKHPTTDRAVIVRCAAEANALMGRFGPAELVAGMGYVLSVGHLERFSRFVTGQGASVIDARGSGPPAPPPWTPKPPVDVARQRAIDAAGRQLVRDMTALYEATLNTFAEDGNESAALAALIFVQCWCEHPGHALEVRGLDRFGRPWPRLSPCDIAGCACPRYGP
jgi:hypothetical protein